MFPPSNLCKDLYLCEGLLIIFSRLFLELSRLQAKDREAASYTVMGSELEE